MYIINITKGPLTGKWTPGCYIRLVYDGMMNDKELMEELKEHIRKENLIEIHRCRVEVSFQI